MTFKHLNELTNTTVDWLKLINNIFSKMNSSFQFKSDDLIYVSDIEYLRVVPKLIAETPKRVITNYFGSKIAQNLAPFANKAFRDIKTAFKRLTSDVREETPLWKDCITNIISMNDVLARLYIDTSFSKKDKEVVSFRLVVNQ